MATATRADEVHKASRERDKAGNGAKASEPFVAVPHLRRTYGYMGGTYGPGDNVEIPRGLAITLGLTFDEAKARPATDISREAPPVPNAPEPEVDDKGAAVGTIPSAVQAAIDSAADFDARVEDEAVRLAKESGSGIQDSLVNRLEPGETLAQPGRLDHALATGADAGEDHEDMLHGDALFRAQSAKSSGGKAGKGSIGEESAPNLPAEERNQGYYDLRNSVTAGRRESSGKKGEKAEKGKRKGGARKSTKKKTGKKKSTRKKAAKKSTKKAE
jgi:hypothetical protein